MMFWLMSQWCQSSPVITPQRSSQSWHVAGNTISDSFSVSGNLIVSVEFCKKGQTIALAVFLREKKHDCSWIWHDQQSYKVLFRLYCYVLCLKHNLLPFQFIECEKLEEFYHLWPFLSFARCLEWIPDDLFRFLQFHQFLLTICL